MLTHGFWFLTCDAFAVYRLAILITRDTIAAPLRDWVHGLGWDESAIIPATANERRMVHFPERPRRAWARKLFDLITCPWCVSVWISAGVVAATRYAPNVWQYGAMWLALTGATGLLAEHS